mgnify:CR=1 FL=1
MHKKNWDAPFGEEAVVLVFPRKERWQKVCMRTVWRIVSTDALVDLYSTELVRNYSGRTYFN